MIFISILILIVAIALPSINKNISSILILRITSIILIYAGALAFNAFYIQSIGSGIGVYSGLFHVTVVSQLIETFLFIIGSLILISWPLPRAINGNVENFTVELTGPHSGKEIGEGSRIGMCYGLIVLFNTLGASLLVSSADLISMYLSIELQSFALYILSTLYRDSESSTSAGLKYFLLGGLSSCLILLGAGLIYSFTGLTNFESIYSIVSIAPLPTSSLHLAGEGVLYAGINQGLSLGLILVIIGFLFKIAAAPLHNWAPDVYDDTPTIVTIWLTIMPKISILIFLLELHTQIGSASSALANNNLNIVEIGSIENILLITSLLSLILGSIVGLAQSRIKRLLAYSTISHIGFLLLALAINTEQSIDSLIFYIVQYSITNLNTFLIILAFGYIIKKSYPHSNAHPASGMVGNGHLSPNDSGVHQYAVESEDIKFISELKGQFFKNPLLSISLTICLFSMAGIPPLIGFFSKQFVLYSSIQSGYYFISIVAIVVSVISASYYLKIIRVMHSTPVTPLPGDSAMLQSEPVTNIAQPSHSKQNRLSHLTGIGMPHPLRESARQKLTNYHSFIISSLTLSILFFVLKPSILLNSTQLLSLSLFNS